MTSSHAIRYVHCNMSTREYWQQLHSPAAQPHCTDLPSFGHVGSVCDADCADWFAWRFAMLSLRRH